MSNIFRDTAVHYFQIPQDAMTSTVWPRLKPVAQSIYIFLLFSSQNHSSEFITLTDQQIADATGVSLRSIPEARKQLSDMRLVGSIRDSKGHIYQILDPSIGKPLQKIGDFNRLSPDLLEEYFSDRLATYDVESDPNGLRARCPFHVTMKRKSRDLSISLSGGGVWRCFDKACARRGKLVEFERLIAGKDGPPITSTQAHHNVADFFALVTRKKAEKEAEELAARRAMM